MIDTNRLLDQLLGGGAPPDQGTQANQAGAQPQANPQAGGAGLLGNLGDKARANPLASGALAGGLAALLLGSKAGRRFTGNAVKYGGMAVVGGLAYKAYQDWQSRKSGQQPTPQAEANLLPPPNDTPFVPAPQEAQDRTRLLVTAMISAAKADGYIDPTEQKLIFDRLAALDLDAESKAYLMDQLSAPLDLEPIVREATQPEVATEVYAASVLAIDPDHPAEKAYLQMLAARLGLEDALVEEIHRTAEAAGATEGAPA